MSEVNQHQRAALAWEVLTKVAENNSLIRYKGLASAIGVHHRAVRFVLELIQDYCLENKLPPLTILVVNQTGLPGEGFVAWDVDHIDEGLKQVYHFNWSTLKNSFEFAKTGLSENVIINQLLDNPEKAKDVYAKIKVRGAAQIIFRKALLRAYNNQCAFCGFSYEFGLQAAHIIPWAKANKRERLDVRNGILLCATHHSLFDRGWLTIDKEFRITYNHSTKKPHRNSEYDDLLTKALDKRKISLPNVEKHRPDRLYLEKHRKEFKGQ